MPSSDGRLSHCGRLALSLWRAGHSISSRCSRNVAVRRFTRFARQENQTIIFRRDASLADLETIEITVQLRKSLPPRVNAG
jgi:hypothetical protein